MAAVEGAPFPPQPEPIGLYDGLSFKIGRKYKGPIAADAEPAKSIWQKLFGK
jgi:hypothetical protein